MLQTPGKWFSYELWFDDIDVAHVRTTCRNCGAYIDVQADGTSQEWELDHKCENCQPQIASA